MGGESAVTIVTVSGSRSIIDCKVVSSILSQFDIEEMYHGGARKGVDSIAAQYAQSHSIPQQVFLPDWDRYGRAAGIIRTREMLDAMALIQDREILCIAIWDQQSQSDPGSRGTYYAIDHAYKKHIPLQVFRPYFNDDFGCFDCSHWDQNTPYGCRINGDPTIRDNQCFDRISIIGE